jgi:predicted phage terminase large subunit-like protein
VVDDPHNTEQAESAVQRTATNEWWDRSMSTRGNNPKTVARVIVMQRLHEEDLTGHVVAKDAGYVHLVLPMEHEGAPFVSGWGPGGAPIRDERAQLGELLHPARFGRAEVEALKRDLGPRDTAGQLQQRPAPAEGALFRRIDWRYWVPPGELERYQPVRVRLPDGSQHACATVELPPRFDAVASSWDCAFKDLDTSDYTCGQVWGRKGPDCYLLDQRLARLDLNGTCRAITALRQEFPRATATLIEDKANGTAAIQTLTRELPGVIAVNPLGGKESRAQAILPYHAAGNLILPHPSIAPWVGQLVEWAAAFPHAKVDDPVDAMTQGVLWLLRGRGQVRQVRPFAWNQTPPRRLR